MRIKTILIGTDLLPESRKTLHFAGPFAEHCGARLVGVHALRPGRPLGESGKRSLEQWQEDNLARLKTLMATHGLNGLNVECRVGLGTAEKVLRREAIETEADLILLLKHNRGPIERLFVGSVARPIIDAAPCPVLIVPPNGREFLPGKTLFCATDFSYAAGRALEWAVRFSKEHGGTLLVEHVMDGTSREPDRTGEMLHRAEARIDKAVGRHGGPPCYRKEVTTGNPADNIVTRCASIDPALVVIGRRGLNEGDYAGLGATAAAILERTEHPLVVVP